MSRASRSANNSLTTVCSGSRQVFDRFFKVRAHIGHQRRALNGLERFDEVVEFRRLHRLQTPHAVLWREGQNVRDQGFVGIRTIVTSLLRSGAWPASLIRILAGRRRHRVHCRIGVHREPRRAHVGLLLCAWLRPRSILCRLRCRLLLCLRGLSHLVAVDLVFIHRVQSAVLGYVDLPIRRLANDGRAGHAEHQVAHSPLHGGILGQPGVQISFVQALWVQLRVEPFVETRFAGAHLAQGFEVAWPRAKGESVQSVKNSCVALELCRNVVRSILLKSGRLLVRCGNLGRRRVSARGCVLGQS